MYLSNKNGGVVASLHRMFDVGKDAVGTRLQLLLLELEEEKYRFIEGLIWTFVTMALGLVALILVSFTIVVLLWETARIPTLVLMTLLYFLAAFLIYRGLKSRLKYAPPPLADTLKQLKKDGPG
jgi:uncharacterized membrane protein YqjE